MVSNGLSLLSLYKQSSSASKYAASNKCIGMVFDGFGRRLGKRLLLHRERLGLSYLLNPVSCVRYFEYQFALDSLPHRLGKCLDISSPRLFSFYVAEHYPTSTILMANPDTDDIHTTQRIVRALSLNTIQCQSNEIAEFANTKDTFDCIWSISVIEHISGSYDETFAVRVMYDALKPGGRLILTVPVDRKFWTEYRDRNYYGSQPENSSGRYFFQRLYDKTAIQEHLIASVGKIPNSIRWYGELVPGRFTEYTQQWIENGLECTVNDPREMVDHYQEFPSWEDMPGMGICGLVFEK